MPLNSKPTHLKPFFFLNLTDPFALTTHSGACNNIIYFREFGHFLYPQQLTTKTTTEMIAFILCACTRGEKIIRKINVPIIYGLLMKKLSILAS